MDPTPDAPKAPSGAPDQSQPRQPLSPKSTDPVQSPGWARPITSRYADVDDEIVHLRELETIADRARAHHDAIVAGRAIVATIPVVPRQERFVDSPGNWWYGGPGAEPSMVHLIAFVVLAESSLRPVILDEDGGQILWDDDLDVVASRRRIMDWRPAA